MQFLNARSGKDIPESGRSGPENPGRICPRILNELLGNRYPGRIFKIRFLLSTNGDCDRIKFHRIALGRNGEREEWGTGGWRRPKTETPTAGCIAVTTERSTRIPNHMICVSFPTFEAKSVLLIWIRHDWFQRIDRRWRHWRRHWRFLELGKFASRRDYSKMVGFQMEAHSLTGKPDQYSKGCLK